MDKYSNYSTQMSYFFYSLKTNWWIIALRGILSIIVGIMAFFMPATTVLIITLMFGAYTIVDGIFYVVVGINRAREERPWGSIIFVGLLEIVAGLAVLIMPQIAAISLVYFVWIMLSGWAIVTGIFEFMTAARLHQAIKGRWLLAFTGLISIISGIVLSTLLWLDPAASVYILGLLIGANAVVKGITSVLLASKFRQLEETVLATQE